MTRARHPRVLLLTEGTYPYVVGGVSTWCDHLLRGVSDVDWQVLPIIADDVSSEPRFTPGPSTRFLDPVRVWSDAPVRWQRGAALGGHDWPELPGLLLRQLIGWEPDHRNLARTLLWCRRHPGRIRSTFRSSAGWASFTNQLVLLAASRSGDVAPVPRLDDRAVAELYHSLYWAARVAATPTPANIDVLHITAAGWSTLPALAHHAEHGTPILLTEHGVYVREAYMASIRHDAGPARRFVANGMARGLARAAYRAASLVTPVTSANSWWESALGVRPERIQVIVNGVPAPAEPAPLPGTATVVSVGRIDPLKDVHTLLRTAALVTSSRPQATFLHYGPVAEGQGAYAQSCYELHAQLGLGERFRFMGATTEVSRVMRESDVVVLTSISEGLPIAVLEAMAEGRPVVSTAVGGVVEAVHGTGCTAPPHDAHGLADAIGMLLDSPGLAATLGARGHARLRRHFDLDTCLDAYRTVLRGLSGLAADDEAEVAA